MWDHMFLNQSMGNVPAPPLSVDQNPILFRRTEFFLTTLPQPDSWWVLIVLNFPIHSLIKLL